jgi:hypothetical protein
MGNAMSELSSSERRRREEAVNFARASIGLEGFKPSLEDEALAQRFIDGEIDLAEFVQVLAPKARVE